MRDQIDGEIERSNTGDRSDREAAHDAPASGGELLPIQREILSVDASALFGGDRKGEDGALNFGSRRLNGLASLLGQRAGKLFFALRHERDNLTKNALALKGAPANAKLKEGTSLLRRRRYLSIPEQGRWLASRNSGAVWRRGR